MQHKKRLCMKGITWNAEPLICSSIQSVTDISPGH